MSSQTRMGLDHRFRPPIEFVQLLRRAKQGGYSPTKKEEEWLADSQPQDGQYEAEDEYKERGGADGNSDARRITPSV